MILQRITIYEPVNDRHEHSSALLICLVQWKLWLSCGGLGQILNRSDLSGSAGSEWSCTLWCNTDWAVGFVIGPVCHKKAKSASVHTFVKGRDLGFSFYSTFKPLFLSWHIWIQLPPCWISLQTALPDRWPNVNSVHLDYLSCYADLRDSLSTDSRCDLTPRLTRCQLSLQLAISTV